MSTTTTDHDEIRSWVEAKKGKPAAVDRTHDEDEVGLIRLMFPKSSQSEHGNLVEITWDEFFEKFEESGLALIYDEGTLFNKLVKRGNEGSAAKGAGHGKAETHKAPAHKAETHKADAHKADSHKAPAHKAATHAKADEHKKADSHAKASHPKKEAADHAKK